MEVPYDPVNQLLGINQNKKTLIQTDTCNPLFIVALFTVAKTWKQPKCPSVDDWLKKRWYIFTEEYDSVKKE